MRAGWYERCGPAHEVIEVGEVPTSTPGRGEVLVRLHASGINPSDYKRRANVKAAMEFPRVIPHSDGAGVVTGIGAGVAGFAEGDRVWVFNGQWARPSGTAAEFICLPAFQVRPLPRELSFAEGACLGIPVMTAHRAVFMDGAVKGKTVYVPGGAGRVGAYAVQFAKWGGARVFSDASSAEKAKAVTALGADRVILRNDEDRVKVLRNETGGVGVDRIIEVDFSANLPVSGKVLAEDGVIVTYGAAREPTTTFPLSPRPARNMSLHFIFVYTMADAAKDAACTDIARAIADNALRHRIANIIPLDELARAHTEAEKQSGTGHMVVEIA